MRPIREWEPSTENSPFLCTETPYYHFVGRNSYRSPLAPLPGPGSGGCQGASLNACARQNAYCTPTLLELSLLEVSGFIFLVTCRGNILCNFNHRINHHSIHHNPNSTSNNHSGNHNIPIL